MSQLPVHLRLIRKLSRRLNRRFSHAEPFDPGELKRFEKALRDVAGGSAYLAKHIPRLARTLALVPSPQETGRALELGCYMQLTPLLASMCGYREVRGAYYGSPGKVDDKAVGDFHCLIDHFDAERDRFPYSDEHFDLVIAGEIIEHLIYDPMHLLLESRRVLREGGYLLVTTPNIAGLGSVAKVLEGKNNPQIYPHYKRPDSEPEIGHMREYTMWELGEAVKAAGFEIDRLFTTVIEEYAGHAPLLKLLEQHGYNTENRGEQTWCLAKKRNRLPINRYPPFIYDI